MEDLLSVVVFVLYLIAVTAAGKNKKNKKKQQKSTRHRVPRFEQAFEQVFASSSAPVSKEKETHAARTDSVHVPEGTDPCHESMLGKPRDSVRFQSVSQVEMHAAGEGEDPCHVFSGRDDILTEESPVYRSPIFDTEDKEAFANDILRGVIMSEVLIRPSHRCAGVGMKRRA